MCVLCIYMCMYVCECVCVCMHACMCVWDWGHPIQPGEVRDFNPGAEGQIFSRADKMWMAGFTWPGLVDKGVPAFSCKILKGHK